MRRVLQLMIEVFDEKERPALLLGMLESASFRDAFDKSIADLPEALSHLVLPLRAAQAVILHGKPNTLDSETLGDGVNLLSTWIPRSSCAIPRKCGNDSSTSVYSRAARPIIGCTIA